MVLNPPDWFGSKMAQFLLIPFQIILSKKINPLSFKNPIFK